MTIESYQKNHLLIPKTEVTDNLDDMITQLNKKIKRIKKPNPKSAAEIEQLKTNIEFQLGKL